MSPAKVKIRSPQKQELDAINQVIEAAIMTWDLPERVKRLSLASYRYNELDFKHLSIAIAEDQQGRIVGVAAWEDTDPRDTPNNGKALLLHGLYVDPSHHRQGIGSLLLDAAKQAVMQQGYDGLLVKAQEDASEFFLVQGMTRLPVDDPDRHYANRFWQPADS